MAVRTWLRNLFAVRTARPARKSSAFRPSFVALEQRDCPAAALFSAGELAVTGTAAVGEAVRVFTQGQDVVVLDGQQEILRTPAGAVAKLTVTTGDGADRVRIDLDGSATSLAQSLQVQISTGDGNDVVDCTCSNVSTTITSNVNLGAGNDSLVGTSINSAATGSLTERIDGGNGTDSISCVQVNPAGRVDTTMIGGNGNDVLFGHLVGSQTSADLAFNAIGGNGDDAIDLLAEGAVHGRLAFGIEGGSGADAIGLSFNLAGPSAPNSLPPSTVTVGGSINAGAGDDRVTVNPGNPYNLAQVQFPQLMQFDGGQGADEIGVLGGVPLNMLPIAPVNFEVQ